MGAWVAAKGGGIANPPPPFSLLFHLGISIIASSFFSKPSHTSVLKESPDLGLGCCVSNLIGSDRILKIFATASHWFDIVAFASILAPWFCVGRWCVVFACACLVLILEAKVG